MGDIIILEYIYNRTLMYKAFCTSHQVRMYLVLIKQANVQVKLKCGSDFSHLISGIASQRGAEELGEWRQGYERSFSTTCLFLEELSEIT